MNKIATLKFQFWEKLQAHLINHWWGAWSQTEPTLIWPSLPVVKTQGLPVIFLQDNIIKGKVTAMLELHSVPLLLPKTYSSSMSRKGAKGLWVLDKRFNFKVSCKLPLKGSNQKGFNCYRVKLQLIQSLMHQFRGPMSWLATPILWNCFSQKNHLFKC